jgi:anti-anti-sigma factor
MSEPEKFRVNVAYEPDAATVTVRGEIDMATIGPLEAACERALQRHPARLRIDLAAVGFVDSSGLKFLIATDRLARESGWALELIAPGEPAMQVFRLTGTDKRLPFVG